MGLKMGDTDIEKVSQGLISTWFDLFMRFVDKTKIQNNGTLPFCHLQGILSEGGLCFSHLNRAVKV